MPKRGSLLNDKRERLQKGNARNTKDSYFMVLPNRHVLSTFECILTSINSDSQNCRNTKFSGPTTF